MKLSLKTRINAVTIAEEGKKVILESRDRNMLLEEWIADALFDWSINSNDIPLPLSIIHCDFQEVGSSFNEYGHKFTLLFGKINNITISVVKLDLAGKVESPNFV